MLYFEVEKSDYYIGNFLPFFRGSVRQEHSRLTESGFKEMLKVRLAQTGASQAAKNSSNSEKVEKTLKQEITL